MTAKKVATGVLERLAATMLTVNVKILTAIMPFR